VEAWGSGQAMEIWAGRGSVEVVELWARYGGVELWKWKRIAREWRAWKHEETEKVRNEGAGGEGEAFI